MYEHHHIPIIIITNPTIDSPHAIEKSHRLQERKKRPPRRGWHDPVAGPTHPSDVARRGPIVL